MKTIPKTGNPSGSTSQSQPWAATHPEYDAFLQRWKKTRDVIGGAHVIRKNAKNYIPTLHDQEEKDYRRYVERAMFLNATSRTLDAMVGIIMRKTPETETTLDEKFMADTDLQGGNFEQYLKQVLEEMAESNHGGTLIDYSEDEERTYFCHYAAESITNWNIERVAGKNELTSLTLTETGTRMNPLTMIHEIQTTYLVYRIEEDGKVSITKTTDNEGAITEEEPIYPVRKGKALERIPFVFHTLDGNQPCTAKGPLEDMVEVNISHFRTSADLENGRHVAGLPTPYAFGFDSETKMVMGTSFAWVTENTEAKVGFLEFNGSGLSELSGALAEKQEQMASLGARIISPKESGDAEAYGTVKLRADSEQATLISMASAASATMSLAMQWAAWWEGTSPEVSDYAESDFIVVSTDFVGSKIDAQTFTALVSAFQMGNLSWATLFYNLQQGEIYKEGWTKDDEEKALRDTPVMTPPIAPPTEPEPKKLPPAKAPAKDPKAPPIDV